MTDDDDYISRSADRRLPSPGGKDWGLFTCQGPNCLVMERANEMYNLACNPHALKDINELRKLVRCEGCATKVATSNGKRLGETGCGAYYLTITLRDMSRTEDEPPPPGTTTYACTHEGCMVARRALDMFNIGIGHRPTDVREIITTIVCRQHADAYATERGTNPCEPGSNVYRLSYSLRCINEQHTGVPAARPARTRY